MSQFIPNASVDHWSNLLWTVGSTDITNSLNPKFLLEKLPRLPAARRKQLLDYFSSPQVHKRLSPQLDAFLHNYSEHKPTSRLGVYFEQLWAFAFEHHHDYQLVHHNLPLRTAGQTLGELDFVVRYLPADTCEHWEVAVKFYLQLPGPYWIGPGLKDRLDIKLKRMAQHQLPFIRRPEVESLLQDMGLNIDRQWAQIPGRLFKALGTPKAQASRKSSRGDSHYWWATPDSFIDYFNTSPHYQDLSWLHLPKCVWLAPLQRGLAEGYSFKQLVMALERNTLDRPLCISALDKCGEVCRGFIVPENWYPRALESLPRP
ncbi:DUF1853 family protein [Microbulbifer sp. GL-2]|uniref:DUF1853 family protein n=1 Tax=Microbulbifer sp. GL-2 TaxID=2591606 RepID=UPI00117ED766|nr:DUF1853 family protein [Microbulbifer sp. GL-2]